MPLKCNFGLDPTAMRRGAAQIGLSAGAERDQFHVTRKCSSERLMHEITARSQGLVHALNGQVSCGR